MAILYAFDEHKNKVAFNASTDITVPMQLSDGSILFYDRGASYGEYRINDLGYPERIDGTIDDGSAESQNWRYLICDQHDLEGTRQWGPYGTNEGIPTLVNQPVGYGLSNSNVMIAKYADNDAYWWKLIKEKRDSTSLKWFMPSINELNAMYNNREIITNTGGDAFQTDVAYWSSSEGGSDGAWIHYLSIDSRFRYAKNSSLPCHLLRRI